MKNGVKKGIYSLVQCDKVLLEVSILLGRSVLPFQCFLFCCGCLRCSLLNTAAPTSAPPFLLFLLLVQTVEKFFLLSREIPYTSKLKGVDLKAKVQHILLTTQTREKKETRGAECA